MSASKGPCRYPIKGHCLTVKNGCPLQCYEKPDFSVSVMLSITYCICKDRTALLYKQNNRVFTNK